MKTTINLPDDLLIEAKVHAARERKTLKEIIETALKRELARASQRHAYRKKSIRWVTASGGLPPAIDMANRETWNSIM